MMLLLFGDDFNLRQATLRASDGAPSSDDLLRSQERDDVP